MLICAEGCFVIPRAGGGGCQTGPRVRGEGARGSAEGGSGALRAAPRVSPKTRPSFKIDGFVTDENRFSKDSKSHPELHRASPKASQELPRVPQVTSQPPQGSPKGLPRVPGRGEGLQGTLGRTWGGILGVLGGPLGSLGVPWVPWGVMGVFGGAPGALLRSAFFEHLKLAPRAPRSPP